MGQRYLEDLLETFGEYVDSLKFAGGSFALMPRERLSELIETAHRFDVEVSTGGFIERVLVQGERAVEKYIAECAEFGFDIIEISAGFISIPTDDWLRLIKRVQHAGLKAKPEVGIRGHLRTPVTHALGDSLRFNHDQRCAGIDKPFGPVNRKLWRKGSLRFQCGSVARPAGARLAVCERAGA